MKSNFKQFHEDRLKIGAKLAPGEVELYEKVKRGECIEEGEQFFFAYIAEVMSKSYDKPKDPSKN